MPTSQIFWLFTGADECFKSVLPTSQIKSVRLQKVGLLGCVSGLGGLCGPVFPVPGGSEGLDLGVVGVGCGRVGVAGWGGGGAPEVWVVWGGQVIMGGSFTCFYEDLW